MQRSHKRIVNTFPINDLNAENWSALNLRTRYYTPRLHVGAFALPAFLEDMLVEVEA